MPKELLAGSVRRVAAVSVLAVTVIAVAIGITIWRYEAALGRSDAATDARGSAALTEALAAAFWHEREAAHEYLTTRSPALVQEENTQARQFSRIAAQLTTAEPARGCAASAGLDGER